MIHPCSKQCKSEFQDKLYGKGRRVFNQAKSGIPGVTKLRCTVCKNEETTGRKEVAEANAKA